MTLNLGEGGGTTSEGLKAALRAATHGASTEPEPENAGRQGATGHGPLRGSATTVYLPRPKICLELGTVEQANATYFALAEYQRGGSAAANFGSEAAAGDQLEPAAAAAAESDLPVAEEE